MMLPSLPGTIGVIITWATLEYRVGRDRHLHRDPLARGDTVGGNRGGKLLSQREKEDRRSVRSSGPRPGRSVSARCQNAASVSGRPWSAGQPGCSG